MFDFLSSGGGGRKLPGEVESDADKEVSDYDDEEEGDDLGEAFEEGHYEGEEGTDYSVRNSGIGQYHITVSQY